jgi:hypothetical protein
MERMFRPPASLDLRKHPRALLQMPVRIRWHGALGTRLETTHTIDVSREGLLVQRAEPCAIEARIWVRTAGNSGKGGSRGPRHGGRLPRSFAL